MVKKAYELGESDGVDVALIICEHGRYTTYRSRDHKTWPPSMAEIVSEMIAPLIYTSVDTDLENCLSSPEEYIAARNPLVNGSHDTGEAPTRRIFGSSFPVA